MAYTSDLEPDQLTALTTLDAGDVIVVGDISDASEVAKCITKTNLIADIKTATDTYYAPVLSADDNYVTDAEKAIISATTASFVTADETKLDFITVTQAVNLDTIESDTATNNAKVSNATHTGDVTGDTALTIANNVVSLGKMADMATSSLIYRKTAGTGAPEVNTLATLKTA